MVKTLKVPLLLLLSGAVLIVLGSLIKIMHAPSGNGILIVGMILEVIGLFKLVVAYAKSYNSKK